MLGCAVSLNTILLCLQAKDKVIKDVEKAVKALKDDAKKHGELYVKFMKKAVEKVSLGVCVVGSQQNCPAWAAGWAVLYGSSSWL